MTDTNDQAVCQLSYFLMFPLEMYAKYLFGYRSCLSNSY